MNQFVSIYVLNLLTSIDNAIVLGGIAKRHRNLFAIGFVSSVVITVCRTLLILGLTSVVKLPGLRFTLGIIVLFVAINLANVRLSRGRHQMSFGRVVVMVVATDLALSVDNIFSLSMLSKNVFVIASAVFLSLLPLLMLLPVIVRVMNHVVWLQVLAAGFVAELGIDSITDDPWIAPKIPHGAVEVIVRVGSAVVVILYGFWRVFVERKRLKGSKSPPP